jgi:hypothetical protein
VRVAKLGVRMKEKAGELDMWISWAHSRLSREPPDDQRLSLPMGVGVGLWLLWG